MFKLAAWATPIAIGAIAATVPIEVPIAVEIKQDIKNKYPTPAKYKEEYPYLKEVDSLALANAQLNLEKAYKNFLKNKNFGFPKYKCKSNPVQSYTTNNQNTNGWQVVNKKSLSINKLFFIY